VLCHRHSVVGQRRWQLRCQSLSGAAFKIPPELTGTGQVFS
jgi:hypothetical protein